MKALLILAALAIAAPAEARPRCYTYWAFHFKQPCHGGQGLYALRHSIRYHVASREAGPAQHKPRDPFAITDGDKDRLRDAFVAVEASELRRRLIEQWNAHPPKVWAP